MMTIDLATLTDRQRTALRHPADRATLGMVPVHVDCQRVDETWATVLEVSSSSGLGWFWVASVSRMRSPQRSYTVGQWKPEWRTDGDAVLGDLLRGVGGDPFDVVSYLGVDTSQLVSYQRWVRLTDAEADFVNEMLRGGAS